MPRYCVCSGNFEVTLDRPTPEEAAADAFRRLGQKEGLDRISLGVITLVWPEDNPDDLIVVYTALLAEENGLVCHPTDEIMDFCERGSP